MTSSRLLFLSTLLLGVAVTVAFHSSGAVSADDARYATAVDGSIATSPPAPVTSRVLSLATDVARVVWTPTSLFRALHLSTGILLALAAAISAVVASRLASFEGSGAVAAAVLVAGATLFGADFATLGLSAHPVPVLLLLLSGAAWAWTSSPPKPCLGGILLGLAAAEHPLVLFALPGFGAFALQASLRVTPEEGGSVVRRSAVGFLLGFCAVFLPILGANNAGLVHVSQPSSPLAALAAWASTSDGSFWALKGPGRWPGGVGEVALALWRNAGPIGLALATLGLAGFFSGLARFARPFLVVHATVAAAVVLGDPKDDSTAAVLVAWPFLFWVLPSLAALESRLAKRPGFDAERAARLVPVVSVVSAAVLFAMNAREIDRSAEKGVEWTDTVIRTLPDDAILITRNPVAVALAADGLRGDVDVVDVGETSTLSAFRSGRMLLPLGERAPNRALDGETLAVLFHATEGGRAIFVDASVYFDAQLRDSLLGDRWVLSPHGLAFRLIQPGTNLDPEARRAAGLAWDGVNVTPETPPSPLRDGLGGSEYFARSLLQSAYLHLEQNRSEDAEREFLLALGHPAANPNIAAIGYARLLNTARHYTEIERTLDRYVRDDQEGAWIARRLQGNNFIRLGDMDRGIVMLQRALLLAPADMAEEKAKLQQTIRHLQATRGPAITESG